MGAGIGSSRPSSFGMSLLSTVGVPGTAAFAALVLGIIANAIRRPGTVAAATALVALLVAKVVGTPDFSTPVLWVLIAACATPTWVPTAVPALRPTIPTLRPTVPALTGTRS
jgi:Na+/H+-dicarboxylate symporter